MADVMVSLAMFTRTTYNQNNSLISFKRLHVNASPGRSPLGKKHLRGLLSVRHVAGPCDVMKFYTVGED